FEHGGERHAPIDLVASLEHAPEHHHGLGLRDLGEKAELAHVHAEDRHAGTRAPGHGEQRPVAAEDDEQIRLAWDGRRGTSGNPGERRGGIGQHRHAAAAKCRDDATREPGGTGPVALDHQADRADAPHHHLRRRAVVPWASQLFQPETRVLASTRMPQQPELFPRKAATPAARGRAPLAERMRPRTVDEFAGQRHLLGPGRVLRDLLASGRLESLILWGPPGSGKTTLARLLGESSGVPTVTFSAVLHGVKELRQIVADAAAELARSGRPTLLFVDEIHRLNKAQQDAFLPHVERGTVVLVGATTENPSFEVIPALLSRTRVLVLEPLDSEDVGLLVDRALGDPERGLGKAQLALSPEARAFLVGHAQGDARVALGTLELASHLARARRTRTLDLPLLEEAAQQRA